MKIYLAPAMILRALLTDPDIPRYGMSLMAETGIQTGTLYPLLAKLKDQGLVTSEREQVDMRVVKRPPRIFYKLTPAGITYARTELTELADWLRPPAVT